MYRGCRLRSAAALIVGPVADNIAFVLPLEVAHLFQAHVREIRQSDIVDRVFPISMHPLVPKFGYHPALRRECLAIAFRGLYYVWFLPL